MNLLPLPILPQYITYFKIAAAALLVVIIFLFGYRVGHKDVDALKAQIAHTESIYKSEIEAAAKEQAQLHDANVSLSSELAAKTAEAEAKFQQAQTKWASLNKSKDVRIAELQKNQDFASIELAKLQAARAAETDASKQEVLDTEIKNVSSGIQKTRVTQDGLECLSVPIPDDYIQILIGESQ